MKDFSLNILSNTSLFHFEVLKFKLCECDRQVGLVSALFFWRLVLWYMVLRKMIEPTFEESFFSFSVVCPGCKKNRGELIATSLSDNLYVSRLSKQKVEKTSGSQKCPQIGTQGPMVKHVKCFE